MKEPDSGPLEDHAEPTRQRSPLRSPRVRVVSSAELLGGDRELLIDHEGSLYRLRLTRSGKLILHK